MRHHWLHNIRARLGLHSSSNLVRKSSPRSQIRVEALEDRIVPGTLTVSAPTDDGSGGTPDTLSWAINQAHTDYENSNGTVIDVIKFQTNVTTSGEDPVCSTPVDIEGNSHELISGDSS